MILKQPPAGMAKAVSGFTAILAALATPSLTLSQTASGSGDVVELDKLVVAETAVGGESLAASSAAASLSKVPGAVSFIGGDAVDRKRALTTADLLSLQPAVFATASGANDGIKIGIRGSGISNNQQYRTGIDFLFEGLTMPGLAQATPPAVFEPYGLDYTEVLVGSNAFDYQVLALGGAINYVSKTGYTAAPFQARLDVGSYGYIKGQVSSGRVVGPFDYYVSVTASRADGYQDHTKSDNFRIVANFGYKISETVTNRLYFRFAEVFFETPGNLTRQQIEDDSSQANPGGQTVVNAYFQNDHNIWIGDKLTIEIDPDTELFVGGTLNYTPLWINNNGATGGTSGYYRDTNLTGTVQYTRHGALFDRDSVTKVGFRAQYVLDSSAYAIVPATGAYRTHSEQDGTNNQVLSISNDLNIAKDLWLRTGLSGIRTQTRNHVAVAPGVIDNTHDDYTQWDYNYVLGLRYDIRPDFQVFANVSRSVEPVVAANNRHPSGNSITKIEHQTGTTFEVGTRARAGIFEGSLSLYRTELRNELLSVEVNPGPPAIRQTTNASPTVHQGIELGLNTTLWESAADKTHRLVLRQTYTYSDFHFKDDATWGGNELPGLPPHFYQAELAYEHPSGFYAGVNARHVSDYFVDYANSLSTRAYTIFGANIGYAPPKKNWEVYLQGTNLTDKNYATSARTQYNLGGADFATFLPGDGLGVYGGFNFHF